MSPYCDLYGGLVLNACIDRYCHATVEFRGDDRVLLAAVDADKSAELDSVGEVGLPLHAAVYRRMCSEFSLGHPSITVSTFCDAPPGSGLGSSSTLVVALIEAFREYFALPLSEYDIARLAYEIERNDCRLEGGRQDQYAATFGGFNVMEFGADRALVNPLRLKAAVRCELEASLVLYYTGVSRESATIIDAQSRHIKERDAVRLAATHQLRREALEMKDALLQGDLREVARIVEAGWQAKKRLADGISNADIEEAFDAALAHGALSGKVSGAGGGGYVMFIVEPMLRCRVAKALGALPGRVEGVRFVDDGVTAWTVR